MSSMTAWRGGAAVFGKVPWHDEFLRPATKESDLLALDEWVFRNADAMTAALPANANKPPGTFGFLMKVDQADPLQAVAGVMRASRDSAGRQYPLFVAASLTMERSVAGRPEVAPILLDSYWQIALDTLDIWAAATPEASDRSLELATSAPFESASSALDLYTGWTRETTGADLSAFLDRPFEWVSGAAASLAALVRQPSRTLAAVRAPLGRAGGSALCFWLDILRRSTRWRAHLPSFFWTHDGDAGHAVLCLGPPTAAALGGLWNVDAADAAVWNVEADVPGPAGPRAEESVASLLVQLESWATSSP
jgi:type VI secretion system ImpM family protein